MFARLVAALLIGALCLPAAPSGMLGARAHEASVSIAAAAASIPWPDVSERKNPDPVGACAAAPLSTRGGPALSKPRSVRPAVDADLGPPALGAVYVRGPPAVDVPRLRGGCGDPPARERAAARSVADYVGGSL